MTLDPGWPRVALVTDRRRTGGRDLVDVVASAVAAGIRFVQLREKDLDDARYAELLGRLTGACAEHAGTVRFALNGRTGMAVEGGHVLHLPASRLEGRPEGARAVGRSVHDADETVRALRAGADYLIAGTVFPSACKPGLAQLGLDGLKAIVSIADGCPVYAIGGVDAGSAADTLRSGATGVAVCGAILGAEHVPQAVRRLLEATEAA